MTYLGYASGMKCLLLMTALLYLCTAVFAQMITPPAANLIATNSGFELGPAGAQTTDWDAIWSRDTGGATGAVDTTTFHSGARSYRVVSTGEHDWSFANSNRVVVPPNSLVTISAWVKCDATSSAQIGVVERSDGGGVLNWLAGRSDFGGTHDWMYVHHTYGPSAATKTVQFRLTGDGPGTVWIDDVSLSITPFTVRVDPDMKPLGLISGSLDVIIHPARSGAIDVALRGSTAVWSQLTAGNVIVAGERKIDASTARLNLVCRDDGASYTATIHLESNAPAVDITLSGNPAADLDGAIEYPPAFATTPGDAMVIPCNEGLLYPVDDPAVQTNNYQLYNGHGGLCMAWFGQETLTGGAGVMAIVGTPDDASLIMDHPEPSGAGATGPVLTNQISWEASKGKWAYDRKIRYVFFASGGYVAQAKQYRAYAQRIGLVKTLADKRTANPNIDKLIGAADIWDWDSAHADAQAQAFKEAGMDRVLWASGESADAIDKINALGFLTSTYDIYQDEYEPSAPAWLPKGDWPSDLIVDRNGSHIVSWTDYQTLPDGTKVSHVADACCSIPGLARAKLKIPAELATKHYTCRFIDTITASPWRECYSPDHPTTRTVDKQTKMQLLDFVSNTERLVTGSETGIDAAVPYEDYFEGMMSLSHYRLPDSGYKVGVYQTPTPDFLKFQIGVGYRIPLFELVYHDCMVDTWYWGDASNQEPEVWDQRDLWNILYGTSPIYILDGERWASQKDRLIKSYRNVSGADRAVGYTQMVSHTFLTPDHEVQQTRWSNGVTITVNFGAAPYQLSPTETVAPLGYAIDGRHGGN